MNNIAGFNGRSPLNEADLTAVFSCWSNTFWSDVPPELLAWLQEYDEEPVLGQLLKLVLADRPVMSLNAGAVAATLNLTRTIDLLVPFLSNAGPEHQGSLLFQLHSIVFGTQPPHLSLTHPTIQTLLKLLAQQTTSDRYMVIRLLSHLGTTTLFEQLIPYLNDPDQSVYYESVTTLMILDITRALPIVQPLLQSEDTILRWCICEALSEHPRAEAVNLLIDRLQHDADSGVRVQAAFALGITGDPISIDALAYAAATDEAVDDLGYSVQLTAARSVVKILLHQVSEGVRRGETSSILRFLTTDFRQSGQSLQLMQTWQEEQKQYGHLCWIEPVSYFRGGDPYTYFEALDKEFGVRACFAYEQHEVHYDVVCHRVDDKWLINSMVRHDGT